MGKIVDFIRLNAFLIIIFLNALTIVLFITNNYRDTERERYLEARGRITVVVIKSGMRRDIYTPDEQKVIDENWEAANLGEDEPLKR
jgi:hypothetical protein